MAVQRRGPGAHGRGLPDPADQRARPRDRHHPDRFRLRPPRADADAITREAYSHEVISHGFWPGDAGTKSAAFYAYGVPEPDGLASQTIHPASAIYRKGMPQYVLLYDDVRTAANPSQTLMDFCQSTYDAIANLAGWDRAALERTRK